MAEKLKWWRVFEVNPWLVWVNMLFFQWFGVRLAVCLEEDGDWSWCFIVGVLPFTGWWGRYYPSPRIWGPRL